MANKLNGAIAKIDTLAQYILEYFPGKIINEGACLTAIAIMEELRVERKEFVEDLKSIDAPLRTYPGDPLDILIKKWEGKQ